MSDLIKRDEALMCARPEYLNPNQEKLASYNQGWNNAVEMYHKQIAELPSAEPKVGTKFYYVESIDDYWIGEDLGDDCTLYYAKWDGKLGFVWSTSRYLPWGEHVVDPTSLWKEYTYPSEPKEIPFTDWITGFVNKYFKGE